MNFWWIILFVLVVLIGILVYSQYKSAEPKSESIVARDFVVGLFVPDIPNDENYDAIINSIQFAMQTHYNVNPHLPQPQLIVERFMSNEELEGIVRHFEQDYAANRRAIISGVTTDQLMIGSRVVAEMGNNTLCISIGSTSKTIESIPNVVSMSFSDEFAAKSMLAYAKIRKQKQIAVLVNTDNTYTRTFAQIIFNSAKEFGFDEPTLFTFSKVSQIDQSLLDLPESTLIIAAVVNSTELMDIADKFGFDRGSANPFQPGISILCVDSCSGSPNYYSSGLDVCVSIPFSSDYTEVTRRLYMHLFRAIPNSDYYYSYLCPFAYDAGYKLAMITGLSGNIRNNFIDVSPPVTAALSTNGIDSQISRPLHGNYHYCYTKNPSYLKTPANEIRSQIYGAVQTMPEGVDIPFRIGNFSWTGGYSILINTYESYIINDEDIHQKMSFVRDGESGVPSEFYGYNEDVITLVEINSEYYVPEQDGTNKISVHMEPKRMVYI